MNDASYYAQPAPFPPPPPRPQWGPFTAGDLLPRIFQIYGDNFAVIFGLSAMAAAISVVLQLPMQLMFPAMAARGADPRKMLAAFAVLIPAVLLLSLAVAYVFCLAFGAIFCAIHDLRNGETISIGRALDQTGPRSFRLFVAYLLAHLRMLGWGLLFAAGLAIVGVVVAVVAHFSGISFHRGGAPVIAMGILVVLAVLAVVVGYIAFLFWLYARYCLFVPIVMAEQLGANASLDRAVVIGNTGGRGRIYVLLMIAVVLFFGIIVVTLPISLVLGISSGISAMHHGANVARSPIPAMVNLLIIGLGQAFLFYPVLGIGITLCYFDLMARRLPPAPITFEALPFQPPPAPEPTYPVNMPPPPPENMPEQ